MSFAQQRVSLTERAGSIGTVALVHAGIGALLIVGLNATGLITPDKPNPIGVIIEPKPLPTPPPTPTEKQLERVEQQSDITVVERPIEIPLPAPFQSEVADPAPYDPVTYNPAKAVDAPPRSGTTPTPAPAPKPAPAPLFDPIAAQPANSTSAWVTTDDYPRISLRRGDEGTTGFRVTVASNGRVSACEITRSSGHSQLDDTTCSNVTRRARFTAARNDKGDAVVGTYTSQVRWQIPR